MKIKIAKLDHTHKLGPYISTISPDIHITRYNILKSPTSNISILLEPYLSLDPSSVLRLGSELLKLLQSNDEYCELVAYEEDLPFANGLYIYSDTQINPNYFNDLKYVGIDYANEDYKVIKVDNNEYKFYIVNDNTRVYQTNVFPSKVYGFKDVEDDVQKELYAMLFERDEFEKYKLPCSNVYAMSADKRIKISNICNSVAKKIKANYMEVCFKSLSTNEIMQVMKESLDNTIFGLVDCFDGEVAKLLWVCDYVKQKSRMEEKNAFIFLLSGHEQVDKLTNYIDRKIMVWNIEIPVMDRGGRLFASMLGSIPNKLNKKEVTKLGKMFVNLRLYEMEDILKDVLSVAIYENKHNKKGEEYYVTYKNFMEVVVKNKKVMDMNRGYVQRFFDMVIRKREDK